MVLPVCSDACKAFYLGRLLGVHLAAVHEDYLERAGHVPHTRLYLLQREGERRGSEAWSE